MRFVAVLPVLLLAGGLAIACGEAAPGPAAPTGHESSPPGGAGAAASGPAAPSTSTGSALSAEARGAAEAITPASIAAPTRFLADDALEGRAPGSRGSELAVKYIATQLEQLGLTPGGDGGTFFQEVPLVSITAKAPSRITATGPKGSLALRLAEDLVVMSGVQKPAVTVPTSELVFVGYGIVAPEYQWDDYKDVDVRGKIVVVMNNDPEGDPKLFEGKTRLWYGRWDYKYLQAAKKGAAGVIIVHTTPSAGYPWQVVVSSNQREKFELPADGEPRVLARMWATEDASRKLAQLGGQDLDTLRARAESRDFRPVPLGTKLGFSFTNTVRSLRSANVIGVLPGTELPKDAVVYTAHHDHLGIGEPKNGDRIYNGAVDNASGVGGLLAIARAHVQGPRPRRSVVFVAVTAEEQGLLGSEWYCTHPTFAPGRIAANLNMDSLNVHGKTSDVGYTGLGKSSLDAVVVELAKAQGRTVHGDAFADRGSFYRSDQFSFAKIGVPSVYLHGGPSFVGKPEGWGKERIEEFERTRYHQPSDEFDPSWDWSGAVQDAQLLFYVGLEVANAKEAPTWLPSDEFAKVPRPMDLSAGRP